MVLVHYGRTPRYAGFGLYWGAVSFSLSPTPACPAAPRAGCPGRQPLAADAVTTSILGVYSPIPGSTRCSACSGAGPALDATAIALNALPILELDGHWALADYLYAKCRSGAPRPGRARRSVARAPDHPREP